MLTKLKGVTVFLHTREEMALRKQRAEIRATGSPPHFSGCPILIPMTTEIESVSFRRPLLDIWTATAVLNCTEDAVLRRIENGEIEWAFNIAKGLATKRCVRILAVSLVDCAKGTKPRGRSFDEVMAVILPGKIERVIASRCAAALNCCNQHVLDLFLHNGLIVRSDLPGRNGQNYVSRRAITELLKARRCS